MSRTFYQTELPRENRVTAPPLNRATVTRTHREESSAKPRGGDANNYNYPAVNCTVLPSVLNVCLSFSISQPASSVSLSSFLMTSSMMAF